MSEILPPAGFGLPQQERMPRIDYFRRLTELDRKKNPHLYIGARDGLGSKWLFVENVAAMLDCTVDFVRRISRHELPAGTIGKRVIYSRADVDEFIAARIRSSGGRFVSDRKPRAVGSSDTKPDASLANFDPIATIRARRGAK